MIIYNKEWLDNLSIRKTSAEWLKKGFITAEEHENVLKKYPSGYRTTGIFARIGLFIFTLIILSSAFGLFNLFLEAFRNDDRLIGEFFFYGIVYYIFAEYFVRKNKFVFTGVIDSILYTAIFCINMGILIKLPNDIKDNEPIFCFISVLPLIAIGALRFADAFLSLIAFVCFFTINALAIFKIGKAGQQILPFENMGLAYLFYYFIIKQKNKEGLQYWKNCFTVLEILSLIAFYLSGNYMSIRWMTENLLNKGLNPGEDIGLAPLFYCFTILVPIIYAWLGLRRKDHILFRLGLILLVAGILSIKYYHSLMPPETAMILSGSFMVLIAYFSIRYLKTPRNGITFEADEQSDKYKTMVNIASIAISQTMSNQPQPVKSDSGTEFGGGDFGGGGAGADY